VLARPEDAEPRRALLRLLGEVRDVADAHSWWEEGSTAVTLIRILRGADDAYELARRLRAGLFALENQIRSRLARAVLLQVKQGLNGGRAA
jgi:hypothetical protein